MAKGYSIASRVDIRNIALIDPVESSRSFMLDIISELGREADIYDTGRHALSHIKSIQMVICAWEVPDMTGAAFIQKIIKSRKKKTPFFVYSKNFTNNEITLIKESGIKNVAKLPLVKAEIIEKLENILDKETLIDPIVEQIDKAVMAMDEKRFSDAISILKETAKNPVHTEKSQNLMAETYLRKKQYAPAENMILKTLESYPKSSQALSLQAQVYSKTGRNEEALALVEKLHEHSPLNIDNIVNLSQEYLNVGDATKAKETLEKGLKVDKDNKDMKTGLAIANAQEGKVDSAIDFLAQMGKSDKYARDLNFLAIALGRKGEYKKAVNMYQTAMALSSDKTNIQLLTINIARTKSKLGEHIEAFELLARIYCESPGFEKAYVLLSREYNYIKEKDMVNKLSPAWYKKVKLTRAKFRNKKASKKVKTKKAS